MVFGCVELSHPHSLTRRHYNPCRVLADSRRHLQPSVPGLNPPVPDSQLLCISPSIHLRFGLPARLLSSGLSKVIFLHGRLSCIRAICPAHLNLVILTVVTRSVSSYRQYSSLYLDLHVASSQMGPYILLNIFLSKTPRCNSPALLRTQFPPHTSGLVLLMSCIWSLYAFYLCF
jgi:hypothetical protein